MSPPPPGAAATATPPGPLHGAAAVPPVPADANRAAGRKASLAFVANAASAALGYAVLLLVGRYLEPEAYGSYLFAVGLVGFLAILAGLGLGQAHQRHVAQGIPMGQALGVIVRLRLATSGVFLALVALLYGAWLLLRGPGFTDATTPRVLAAAVVLQLLAGMRQLLLDTWLGQQRINRVEAIRLADTAIALSVLGAASLVVAHVEGRWSPVPAVGAWLADAVGVTRPFGNEAAALLLTASYLVAKAATLAVAFLWAASDRVRIGAWDAALARSYVRFALPVALAGVLGLVVAYTDTLMLGYFWTAREVGLYGAAQKLSVLATLLAAAVGTVLFPRFAQLRAAGEHAREEETFRKAERYLLLLTVPVAAALAALPAQGIHIAVGDRYLGAADPLRILAATAVVAALLQPMASRFMGAGRTDLVLRSAGIGAGANFLLNLALIPPWSFGLGALGAAAATFTAWSLSYLYLRHHTRRVFGTPWIEGDHLRILAAGVGLAAAWWLAAGQLPPSWVDRFWELAAWGIVGAAAYVGLLMLVGEVTAEDRAFVRKAAHPRELLAEFRGR